MDFVVGWLLWRADSLFCCLIVVCLIFGLLVLACLCGVVLGCLLFCCFGCVVFCCGLLVVGFVNSVVMITICLYGDAHGYCLLFPNWFVSVVSLGVFWFMMCFVADCLL